jgi:aminoglycoside/choline kinase family phosphotransferase
MNSFAQLSPPFSVTDRSSLQKTFLHNCNLNPYTLGFLAGDASFRKYYRLKTSDVSYVLMDAPPPENPTQFCQVATYLRSLGFSAPQIIAHDLDSGFVLLQDFGDKTYTKLLQEGYAEKDLYELATDILISLHTKSKERPSFIPFYTIDKLLEEASLVIDWYVPQIPSLPPLSQEERLSYITLWKKAFEKTLNIPQSLVLRDYHVDNLMILENQKLPPSLSTCGLLDFQDALWGPIVYDLVSLLEDARRDVSPDLRNALWKRYLNAFPSLNPNHLIEAGTILSAGRHAKIIGIFTRLAVRDQKPHYLPHIPRVWRLLEDCLIHPSLQELKDWFDRNIFVRIAPHHSVRHAELVSESYFLDPEINSG